MIKLFTQGPALPEVLASRYHIAQLALLDAEAAFEHAEANLKMYRDRVQRLKAVIEEAK